MAIELGDLMNRLVLMIGVLINDPFTPVGRGAVLEGGDLGREAYRIHCLGSQGTRSIGLDKEYYA